MVMTLEEFEVKPAVRRAVRLLIGFAGGTGSGKTYTALRFAKGMSGGKRFGVVDTENGRASMYADFFDFDVVELTAPFTPMRYLGAIKSLQKKGYGVVVVDQFSHEWEGEGGMLDQHDTNLDEMVRRSKATGDNRADWQLEESHNMRAWIDPKMDHKRMMTHLTQMDCQVILNFRAEDKIEIAKEKDDRGRMKTVVRPKVTLTGTQGWVPICEKRMPFELTASFLLTAEKPGVPVPIKLQEQHKIFFPLDQAVTEEAGIKMAAWAKGSAASGIQPGGVQGGAPGAPQAAGAPLLDLDDIRDIETACVDAELPTKDLLAWLSKKAGFSELKAVPKDKKQSVLDAIVGLASRR